MADNPGEWVSGALLDGDPGDPCLWMGGAVTRGEQLLEGAADG